MHKKQENFYWLIKEHGSDILSSENFRETKNHIQHGTIPVHSHSINVARYSLAISKKIGIKCDQRCLVRGALLHDYFLYDWHHKDYISPHRLHGFFHPGVALRNALKEYELSELEKDIIKKHMWPLTIVPPLCREAWIVTLADKYCSFFETIRIQGKGRRNKQKAAA